MAEHAYVRDLVKKPEELPYKVAPHSAQEQPIATFKFGEQAQDFARDRSKQNSIRWVITRNGKPYTAYFRGEPTDG